MEVVVDMGLLPVALKDADPVSILLGGPARQPPNQRGNGTEAPLRCPHADAENQKDHAHCSQRHSSVLLSRPQGTMNDATSPHHRMQVWMPLVELEFELT